MERPVENILAAEKGVAAAKQPPQDRTREERIARLAQAIIRVSAWQRSAAACSASVPKM